MCLTDMVRNLRTNLKCLNVHSFHDLKSNQIPSFEYFLHSSGELIKREKEKSLPHFTCEREEGGVLFF